MLIVIVIIGILAAALIPRLTGIQAKSRDTARSADLRNIGQAVRMYQVDVGNFPIWTGTWTGASNLGTTLRDYISEIPKDGNQYMPYQYQTNNAANIFILSSLIEGTAKSANYTSTGTTQKDLPRALSGMTLTNVGDIRSNNNLS